MVCAFGVRRDLCRPPPNPGPFCRIGGKGDRRPRTPLSPDFGGKAGLGGERRGERDLRARSRRSLEGASNPCPLDAAYLGRNGQLARHHRHARHRGRQRAVDVCSARAAMRVLPPLVRLVSRPFAIAVRVVTHVQGRVRDVENGNRSERARAAVVAERRRGFGRTRDQPCHEQAGEGQAASDPERHRVECGSDPPVRASSTDQPPHRRQELRIDHAPCSGTPSRQDPPRPSRASHPRSRRPGSAPPGTRATRPPTPPAR